MKKIASFIIYFFILNTQAQAFLEISAFTEQVYKRYYFIARIEKTIEFFSVLKENNYFSIDLACIKKLSLYQTYFKNKHISKTINKLIAHQTIDPLITIWHEFCSYKYLNDECFLQEFTKLILIFSERILSHINHHEEFLLNISKIQTMLEHGFRIPEVEQLDYIDEIITLLQKIILKKKNTLISIKPFLQKTKPLPKNYTQAVSQRLYYLNRLQKAVINILNFSKKPQLCFATKKNCLLAFDKKITFKHERILLCINTMENECSLQPFAQLWHEFIHYKYLDDALLIAELTKVIFILEKNIITNYLNNKPFKRTSFEYLQLLYEKIDLLPLEEILNGIDLLAKELPLISEKYELVTDMPWREWFKKYWWAPPLILATISLKFLLTMKNIKLMFNLLSPAPQVNNEAPTIAVVEDLPPKLEPEIE